MNLMLRHLLKTLFFEKLYSTIVSPRHNLVYSLKQGLFFEFSQQNGSKTTLLELGIDDTVDELYEWIFWETLIFLRVLRLTALALIFAAFCR